MSILSTSYLKNTLLLTLQLGGLAGNMTFSRQAAREQRKPFGILTA
jgi:hypothetical protein